MGKLRDSILAARKPAPTKIELGDWPAVYVRTLTVKELLDQEGDQKDDKNRPAIARAFCRLICEEDGSVVFDSKNAEDIESVLNLPWPMVRRALEEGNKVNKLQVGEDAKNA